MPTTNTWTYADWRAQATDALKLARLELHLEELAQHTMGHAGRTSKRFPVDPGYMARMENWWDKLNKIVNPTSGLSTSGQSIAKTKARFAGNV